MMNNIFTIITLVVMFSLILIRCIVTIQVNQRQTPEIKSSDNNISTGRITQLCLKFLETHNLGEWKVIEVEHYVSYLDNINYKTKKILISKLPFVSVGYELENMLGNLWFAKNAINKVKGFNSLRVVNNVLSVISFYMLVFFSLLQFFFWFFMKYDLMMVLENGALYFIVNYHIIFIIMFVFLLMYFISIIYLLKSKNFLELNFENEIAKFIKDECFEYKNDLVAARAWSIEWKMCVVLSFNKRSGKYLGPFVVYK